MVESKQMRGIYSIPVTPFDEKDRVDEDDLRAIVDFCVEAGGHGIVTPVNASEFTCLSEAERKRITEIVIQQADGRIPVIIGTAAPNVELAVELSRYARDQGADGVIAMPQCFQNPDEPNIYRYYKAISDAIDVPIFVQNYAHGPGTAMSAQFMVKMTKEIEHVDYIKEETSIRKINETLELADHRLKGIFGGMAGRHMFNEISRGACGSMPACDVTDVHAEIWDTYESGDMEGARRKFNILLPLLNMESMLGVVVYKEVLKRRGIIRNAGSRNSNRGLDKYNSAELDRILADVSALFRVK